jgi:hypothetical protein
MGKIKNRIKVVLLNIQLWLVKRHVNKCNVFRNVAISHARIITSSLFESNTVMENFNVAFTAVNKLLNVETQSFEDEINLEQVEELTLKLKINKDVLNLLAEYNLALSNIFRRISIDVNKHLIDEYTTKAKLLNADIEPFNQKSFNKRLKEVKKEQKYLQKQNVQILNNKIAKEKENNIGEISLKFINIPVLISLFTSFFVISGYYYNSSLLEEFNIKSDHFYLISDYISTSVSLIKTTLIWTGIFIVSLIIGANDRLGNRIKEEQLNIKINDEPPNSLPLLIIFINIMNLFFMLKGHFETIDMIISLNGMIISIYFIQKIPFHYFKHPIKVYGTVLVCIGFFWNLNIRVNDEIQKITSDDYQPRYLVKFNEKMVKGESLEFIALNSNYLIMRNTDSKSIEIYPKTYINKLTSNPNQVHDLDFIESVIAFIESFSELYEAITKETDKKSSVNNL